MNVRGVHASRRARRAHQRDRCWEFEARFEDRVVGAAYSPRRGDGGHGSLQMWQINGSMFLGKYMQTIGSNAPGPAEIREEEALMDWLRPSLCDQALVRRIVARVPRSSREGSLPVRIRRQLLGERRFDM